MLYLLKMFYCWKILVFFALSDRYICFCLKNYLHPSRIILFEVGCLFFSLLYIIYMSYIYTILMLQCYNVIMKTMCPPGYHHNGFVATHALGHTMYGDHMLILFLWELSTLCVMDHLWSLIYIYIYIYILYIYIYIIYIHIVYYIKFEFYLKLYLKNLDI